jgi:tetratricopeptide (TPR) repeat protein
LEAYLKGRFYWGQYTAESLTKGIEFFEQATRLDPAYAAAYAGLSESWTGLGWIGARPWAEVRAMAKDAAMKALAIDEALSDAHAALAGLSLREWDWKTAEAEAKKAIALNPGYVTAHLSHSSISRYLGRPEESIAEARRAFELDPLAVLTNEVLANAYLSARRYDLAIAQCRSALELHPEESSLHHILGWAHVFKGIYDKGRVAIKKSLALDGEHESFSPDLAYIDSVTGNKPEARKTLGRLLALATQAPIDPGHLALIYVGLRQHQEALPLLQQAYSRHSAMMSGWKVDARFDAIARSGISGPDASGWADLARVISTSRRCGSTSSIPSRARTLLLRDLRGELWSLDGQHSSVGVWRL